MCAAAIELCLNEIGIAGRETPIAAELFTAHRRSFANGVHSFSLALALSL